MNIETFFTEVFIRDLFLKNAMRSTTLVPTSPSLGPTPATKKRKLRLTRWDGPYIVRSAWTYRVNAQRIRKKTVSVFYQKKSLLEPLQFAVERLINQISNRRYMMRKNQMLEELDFINPSQNPK